MERNDQPEQELEFPFEMEFLMELGKAGKLTCSYESGSLDDMFREYFSDHYPTPANPTPANLSQETLHQAVEIGVTPEYVIEKVRAIRHAAVETYTQHAVQRFAENLPEAIRDTLLTLFVVSAMRTWDELKKRELRGDKWQTVLPDIDRPGLFKIALQVADKTFRRQLGIKRGGSEADYNLMELRLHYDNYTLPKVQAAKKLYKALEKNKIKNWRQIVKEKFNDLPDDLISRLSGNPVDLPEEFDTRGGTPMPKDIALEWAARRCGVPDYHYSLAHLEDMKRAQKRQG